MNSADITVVVITKNEAHRISACLASVPAGAHTIVYDALSGDGTVELARAAGARTVRASWEGFVRARQAAAALVTTPWTFMLDADERMSADLARELQELDPSSEIGGYSVPRRNHFAGRWVRSGGWWPDRLIRLFRTGRARLVARGPASHGVHETWAPSGEVRELRSPIEHYSYDSPSDYRRKFSMYTDLESSAGVATLGAVASAWLVVPARFAWYWLRRGGIFEGWRGALVCGGNAAYPAVVSTKRWLRGRARRQGAPV